MYNAPYQVHCIQSYEGFIMLPTQLVNELDHFGYATRSLNDLRVCACTAYFNLSICREPLQL